MVFSSVIFLCFFLPVMIIGYYVLPEKLRNLFLVLGSLFFYAWGGPDYIYIMLASIAGNYVFGLLIDRFGCLGQAVGEQAGRMPAFAKAVLIVSVLYNLGILFYFKYYTFALTTIHDITGKDFYIPEIVLPIGISFYTFQGMSYVIDVYRSIRQKTPLPAAGSAKDDGTAAKEPASTSLVQKNPLKLALYISMFPQLIAGPIVRYTDIKDRLAVENRPVSTDRFAKGLERFIIGLAKKAILANSIGEVADKIFTADVAYLGVPIAWLGAICYTLQIYYDFSGYSDMAIGLGRIFGFDFMENFNYPYISRSVREFWRRWHISLSTWFRDYLYIPLGGSRQGNVYLHLLIVFMATGIWHGAAWGFLIWGLWHGAFLILERLVINRRKTANGPDPKTGRTAVKKDDKGSGIRGFFGWLYTMLVVILGWVLFKLEEWDLATSYIGAMFGLDGESYVGYSIRFYLDNRMIFLLIVAILAAIPWGQLLPEGCRELLAAVSSNRIPAEDPGVSGSDTIQPEGALSLKAPGSGTIMAAVPVKRILLIALLFISLMFVVNSTYNPFIYFRF
ncbi:MAG: MBOAT family protein [Lachnospiraceae bacterium]|nr:MBOAT family protein [Lachnospiraceae bacterium]